MAEGVSNNVPGMCSAKFLDSPAWWCLLMLSLICPYNWAEWWHKSCFDLSPTSLLICLNSFRSLSFALQAQTQCCGHDSIQRRYIRVLIATVLAAAAFCYTWCAGLSILM